MDTRRNPNINEASQNHQTMKNLADYQILVTGGNGAIGCNLVRNLLDLGAKVTVLDDFSQGKKKNFPAKKNLMKIKGDITSEKILSKVFSRHYDYVFHLAARFANELSVKDPLEDLRVNVQGTLQTLFHSAKNKVGRFLYTSSSSIYGPQNTNLCKENSIPHPSTPYAASKLSAEHYCHAISELYDLDYTIVRLSNSYGPYDPPGRYRNVIPNFLQAAIQKKDLVITGTGKETRDFTYVDDCVNGIILAATSKRGKNATFNLGTGKETKMLNLAKLILQITKSRSNIVFKSRRSFDHIKNRKMDISKAKKLLGYTPFTNLQTGLQSTYDWFVSRK